MPGNGKTPVEGVPMLPMPVVERSRAYARRASDKPSHKALRIAATVFAIASPALTGGWWLARQAVVTRSEWTDGQRNEAMFHGEINETLRTVRVSLQKLDSKMDDVRDRAARIEGRQERTHR